MDNKYPTQDFKPLSLSPTLVQGFGSIMQMGANYARLGERRSGNAYQPHFQLNNTATLAGAGTAIAPGIGTAIGAGVGLGLDAFTFMQGKKNYVRDLNRQNFQQKRGARLSDRSNMDFTYQI